MAVDLNIRPTTTVSDPTDAARDARKEQAHAAQAHDLKAAEAFNNAQLNTTVLRDALRALRSLNLTNLESRALKTLLPTLLPRETVATENPVREEPSQTTPTPVDVSPPAANLPPGRQVTGKERLPDSGTVAAHGDENGARADRRVEQKQADAKAGEGKKIYGNNPESAVDRALAKALPTVPAQQNFAEALRANQVNVLAQSLEQLTPPERTAALTELEALTKALQAALVKTPGNSAETVVIRKALGQAQALTKALTPRNQTASTQKSSGESQAADEVVPTEVDPFSYQAPSTSTHSPGATKRGVWMGCATDAKQAEMLGPYASYVGCGASLRELERSRHGAAPAVTGQGEARLETKRLGNGSGEAEGIRDAEGGEEGQTKGSTPLRVGQLPRRYYNLTG